MFGDGLLILGGDQGGGGLQSHVFGDGLLILGGDEGGSGLQSHSFCFGLNSHPLGFDFTSNRYVTNGCRNDWTGVVRDFRERNFGKEIRSVTPEARDQDFGSAIFNGLQLNRDEGNY